MLNEVKRLCKNDFSNIVKEYQVVQYFFPATREIVKKFDYRHEAVTFASELEKKQGEMDLYSFFSVEEVE